MPEDEAFVGQARAAIEALNEKYRDDRSDIFFLFHRSRRWNPQESVWMGHERSVENCSDLNTFLRGDDASSFSIVEGDTASLGDVNT